MANEQIFGRFGYRQMDGGPLAGKWPVFDHSEQRVTCYCPTEAVALGTVLLAEAQTDENTYDKRND